MSLLSELENDLAMEDGVFSTVNIPCPVGEFTATVAGFGKKGKAIQRRSGVSKTSGEPYFIFNVNFKIEDPEVCEECKQSEVYVTKSIMLRLDEEKCDNLDATDADQQLWVLPKDGNPEWGKFMRWAEQSGLEREKTWAKFWLTINDQLTGKEAKVTVVHRVLTLDTLDADGNPETEVRAEVKSLSAV